jgi:two-component system response regulator (stage 0 sporulation protein A)
MKKKIVIADADERFCSELVAALQDSAELEVVGTATDGEQAILLVKHHRPDILVLDTLLPKYDGLTVLERLRKTYFCPKALIVSAFISNYVAATAVRMGVQQIIRKPCHVDVIVKHLHAMAMKARIDPVIFLWDGEQNVTSLVTRILHDIGVPAHIKGYQYLREAIIIAVKDMDVCNAMEKVLYPRVAKVFHTTPKRVIRAMRHAITVIWRKSNRAIIEKHCGYLGGKPNPSQFIEVLVEDVQWRLDKDI